MLIHETAEGFGHFNRIQIFALDVLNDRKFEDFLVVELPHDHRNGMQTGALRADGDAVRGARIGVCRAHRDGLSPAVLARRAPALVQAFAARGWPLPQRIDRVYVSTLAQQQLGWQPRHGFDEVLRQLDAGAADVQVPRGA